MLFTLKDRLFFNRENGNAPVARGVTGRYVSHAKKVPFVSNTLIRIDEPDDMWFDFGNTIEEALDNLKKTLP